MKNKNQAAPAESVTQYIPKNGWTPSLPRHTRVLSLLLLQYYTNNNAIKK
jgi:hypothetical protein